MENWPQLTVYKLIKWCCNYLLFIGSNTCQRYTHSFFGQNCQVKVEKMFGKKVSLQY
uniref:Uncharacterized protein n=1 Tax=Ciona intestinalis TaxID=7719 RepID=H2XZQ2_CIOIN